MKLVLDDLIRIDLDRDVDRSDGEALVADVENEVAIRLRRNGALRPHVWLPAACTACQNNETRQ